MRLTRILTLVLLLAAAPAWADVTFWATPTGSNTVACTDIDTVNDTDTPPASFGTIGRAWNCTGSTPGAKVNIRGGLGNYTSSNDRIKTDAESSPGGTGGTSEGTRIVIQGAPGEATPTIRIAGNWYTNYTGTARRDYITIKNLNIDGALEADGGGASIQFMGAHARVENVDIANSYNVGVFEARDGSSSHHLAVVNTKIHGYGRDGLGYGVYVSTDDALIEGNEFYSGKGGYIQAHDANAGAVAARPIIRRNYGKDVIKGTQAGYENICLGVGAVDGQNAVIVNNIFDGAACTAGAGGSGLEAGYGPGVNKTFFYQNTVTNWRSYGVQLGVFGASNNSEVKNNLILGQVGEAVRIEPSPGTTGVIQTTNRTTGTITDFTVSSTNFRLKAGSAANAAGTAIAGYAYNGAAPSQGAFSPFTYSTASINETKLDVTLGMNLNAPVLPATGQTGWTVGCSGGANCGTPVVASAAKLTGTDSVVRLTLSGLGGGGVCEVGQTWTVTYNAGTGNVTDSALIGNLLNQPMTAFTASAVVNNCGSAPPADPGTPHIYYKMDETSGTNANDESANNLDGTHTNGPTVNVTGKKGRAVSYAVGGNDITAVPYGNTVNPSTQSLTICMGVLPDAGLESGTYIYFGPPRGTDQRLYLGWRNGYHAQGVQSLSYTTPTPNEFPVSAGWAHVCQVVNSGTDTATLYVNGVAGTSSASVKAFTSFALSGNFQIGQMSDYAFEIPGVTIDEVKIYTSALSAANIATLYAAWEPPSPPSTCTLAQVNHQWILLRQNSGGTVENYRALSATVNVVAGGAVMLTIQTDVTVAGCSVAERLRYNVNGGATFLEVPNLLGADGVAFYGSPADTDPDILKGAVTCCLSGALTAINGATQTNADAVPVVPFTTNSSGVHRSALRFDASAAGKTFCFKAYTQQGQAFSSYNPAAGACVVVVPMAAGSGF